MSLSDPARVDALRALARAAAASPEALSEALAEALGAPEPTTRDAARAALDAHLAWPPEALAGLPPSWDRSLPGLVLRVIEGPGREQALRAIQHLGAALLAPALVAQLLLGARWGRRKALAWALAQLGAVGALADCLRAADPDARAAAARGLGQCGARADVLALAGALGDEHWRVRQAAAISLGKLGATSCADALAAGLAAEPHFEVRRSLVWALGRLPGLGGRHGALALTAATDPHGDVRAAAARALKDAGVIVEDVPRGTLPTPQPDAPGSPPPSHGSPRLDRAAPARAEESDPAGPPAGRVTDPAQRLALGLRDRATAEAAALALAGNEHPAAVDGLVELLGRQGLVGVQEAARALAGVAAPTARRALVGACGHVTLHVRLEAVAALASRRDAHVAPALRARLAVDPSWMVRRAAVIHLAMDPDPDVEAVVEALADPLWRVRQEAAERIVGWLERGAHGPRLEAALSPMASRADADPDVLGALRYVEFYRQPPQQRAAWLTAQPPMPAPEPFAAQAQPWWDDDPAVACARLEALPPDEARAVTPLLPALLGHMDEPLTEVATALLVRHGALEDWHACLAPFADLRRPRGRLLRLMERLGPVRRAALSVHGLGVEEGPPREREFAWRWSLDALAPERLETPEVLAGVARLLRSASEPETRIAAVRALGRGASPEAVAPLLDALADPVCEVRAAALEALMGLVPREGLEARFDWRAATALERRAWAPWCDPSNPAPDVEFWRAAASSPDEGLRRLAARAIKSGAQQEEAQASGDEALGWAGLLEHLQADPSFFVREEALTLSRAALIWAEPSREPSWRVLRRAARLLRRNLDELAVEVAPPPLASPLLPGPPPAPTPQPPPRRRLGTTELLVAPLGLTGHYGLPHEGFERARQGGLNLFFWEPPYHGMTAFFRAMSPARRREQVVVAGTMGYSAASLRADLEHILMRLRLEQLPVFLLFWARSPDRIDDEARGRLEALKAEGLIGAYGFSTHQRSLALTGLERGWEVVMLRHNAAHRGPEAQVLPRVIEQDAGMIAFSALCYGRMLTPPAPGLVAPSAADCYRYCLAQPGVSTVLTAPATLTQLEHNLSVLGAPPMPPEEVEAMRRFGDAVYLHHQPFARFLRHRG